MTIVLSIAALRITSAWVLSSSSTRIALSSSLALNHCPRRAPSVLFSSTSSTSQNNGSLSAFVATTTAASSKDRASTASIAPEEANDTTNNDNDDDDDDDDDYEYIEYEALTEQEFVGSEWIIGTNWNNRPNTIEETWVRLLIDPNSGKNIAIWGNDNSPGEWTFDIASQFLSISKSFFWGKNIWACTVTDYYYLQGTVRGWSFWAAASVLAQWQAKRLGVDPDEAGVAPWFLVDDRKSTALEGIASSGNPIEASVNTTIGSNSSA